MSTLRNEERIGEAWHHHRMGENSEAVRKFQEILKNTPNNVDAYYGMGLAHKADGNLNAAKEAFEKAKELADNAYGAVRTTSDAEGHHGTNDLDITEDDRFMMLSRMLKQRIAEVS